MLDKNIGWWLIGLGAVCIVVGAVTLTGAFRWFGRMPGDIRIESEHVRVYVPITTMVLVSLLLTLLAWILRRFF